MVDAKRLAEMMKPEKMRELAESLDNVTPAGTFSGAMERDDLACAAAVLREVAGRGATDTVIEVEASGEWWNCPCRDHGYCLVHHEIEQGATALACSSCEAMPDDCPLRKGRVIVQAKKG